MSLCCLGITPGDYDAGVDDDGKADSCCHGRPLVDTRALSRLTSKALLTKDLGETLSLETFDSNLKQSANRET